MPQPLRETPSNSVHVSPRAHGPRLIPFGANVAAALCVGMLVSGCTPTDLMAPQAALTTQLGVASSDTGDTGDTGDTAHAEAPWTATRLNPR